VLAIAFTPRASMQSAVNRLARCLKPGGVILFRDYGHHDLAQVRLYTHGPNHTHVANFAAQASQRLFVITAAVITVDYSHCLPLQSNFHPISQLRFKKGRYLEKNFYIRGDGTRVYFYTTGRR